MKKPTSTAAKKPVKTPTKPGAAKKVTVTKKATPPKPVPHISGSPTLDNIFKLATWCINTKADYGELSMRQMAIFVAAATAEQPMGVRDLAGLLNVNKPTITRGIDRLSELGLMVRGDDANDRRLVLALLTEKGATFAADLAKL